MLERREMLWNGIRSLILAALVALPGWAAGKVCVAHVQGTIGPATATYLSRAHDEAARQGAQCLVIQLDTPGGLLDSTKEIIQAFFQAPVPTVVYVSPAGAWAGSAGCFITLAADVAAMAPSTSIGAAHPVGIAPGGEKTDDTMKQKLENFASSYIEAIAEKRHRNTAWARASVRDSEALTAAQALERNVIDLVADDMPDLLKRIDGRLVNGKALETAGAVLVDVPMNVQEKLFQVFAHPQVMLLLMLLVIYGVIGEMTNPGAILPGVAGLIALLLLLYLASVLPMNVAGLALVGAAIVLFIIDVFAPTHGVLTAGGIVAFFLGAFMLFDRSEPFLRLSMAWILPATVVTALFFIFIVSAGIQAQRAPAKSGAAAMVGLTVIALERIDASGGRVFIEGEYWNAVSDEPVEAGQAAEIVALEGLRLKVKLGIPDKEVSP